VHDAAHLTLGDAGGWRRKGPRSLTAADQLKAVHPEPRQTEPVPVPNDFGAAGYKRGPYRRAFTWPEVIMEIAQDEAIAKQNKTTDHEHAAQHEHDYAPRHLRHRIVPSSSANARCYGTTFPHSRIGKTTGVTVRADCCSTRCDHAVVSHQRGRQHGTPDKWEFMRLSVDSEPWSDHAPAMWLSERCLSADRTVGGYMPDGFEGYVRILHPAYLIDQDRWVSWAEIAQWSGKRLERTSDSKDLMVRADGTSWKELSGRNRPGEGPLSVGDPYFAPLSSSLAEETARPERIWALFDWISYPFRTGSRSLYATRGHRISSLADRLTRFARRRRAHRQSRSLASRLITIAGSQYVLHKAALADDDHQGLHESPNYWWPEDRTWLVYANVDCPTTYVGGSTTLAQRLLEDDQIEAVPAELDDPLDGHG
jgi:hypothetical protein